MYISCPETNATLPIPILHPSLPRLPYLIGVPGTRFISACPYIMPTVETVADKRAFGHLFQNILKYHKVFVSNRYPSRAKMPQISGECRVWRENHVFTSVLFLIESKWIQIELESIKIVVPRRSRELTKNYYSLSKWDIIVIEVN